MNNVNTLFENLMTYNDVNSTGKKSKLKENKQSKLEEKDSTLINLSLEIPTDTEEITPEDVDINVGVMNLENEDEESDNQDLESSDEVDEISVEDEESEKSKDKKDEDEEDDTENDKESDDKKESLNNDKLEKFKKFKEMKKCNKSECNPIEKESKDVETAKQNILNRVKNKTESKKSECTDKEACKYNRSRKLKESLARLDTTSLNKLITAFVRENYKNIDKIVINKAILENKKLTLKGKIKDLNGKTESIALTNRGFDPVKCENKRFIIDFKDDNNLFNVVKESIKQPFVFTASIKNHVMKFESLKYDFKTKITEGKVANVYGTCNILKESKTHKYNRSKMLKESSNQTEITVSCAPFDDEADKQEYADYVKDKYNLKLVDYVDGGDANSSLTLFGTFDDIKKYFTDVKWDDWQFYWAEYGDDVKQQYLKSINSTDEEDWYDYLYESKTHKYNRSKMLKESSNQTEKI